MIAWYKQNIHLLPFADVFLKSLFVFAGGGEIAQLVITGGRLLNWSKVDISVFLNSHEFDCVIVLTKPSY